MGTASLLALLWALPFVLVVGGVVESLPTLNIDIKQTSVSGLSGGAFFAVQMHVAHSSIMKGAGIFAGGPYDCAQGRVNTALTSCMNGIPKPNVQTSINTTTTRSRAGSIDDTANLLSHRVYMFSGKEDTTVKKPVMDALFSY